VPKISEKISEKLINFSRGESEGWVEPGLYILPMICFYLFERITSIKSDSKILSAKVE